MTRNDNPKWMKLRNKEIIGKFRKLRRSKRTAKHAVKHLEQDYGLHGSTLRRMLHASGAWIAVLCVAVFAHANTFYLQAAGCAVAPHDTAQVLVEAGADSGITTFVKGTVEYDSRQFTIVGVTQLENGASINWSTLAPTYCGDDATFVFFIDGMAFTGVRPVALLHVVPRDAGCQSNLRWSCGNPPGIALIEILADEPHGGAWNRTDPNLRVRDAVVTTTPCAGVAVRPASLGFVKALYR